MAFARRAEIELAANHRQLKKDLSQAQGELGAFGKSAGSKLKAGFAAGMGSFAAIGSIAGFGALGKDVLAAEDKLTRIGIQAGASESELDALRATMAQVAKNTGLVTSDVLGSVDALVNLQGKAGFSADKMTVLARAAQATGAPMRDLAGVTYALDNAFKLTNAKELEGALNAVISAGKSGSVPLNEMSVVLQQIATNFAKLTASGKDGAADLSATIQVARKGFGSAAEVGTGIKAFVGQLEQNAAKLRAFGVEAFKVGKGGAKTMRPLREIFDQIANSRLMKDPELLSRVFRSAEAKQLVTVMLTERNRKEFEKLSQEARNANDIQQDLQRYLNSNAGKIQKAMVAARTELEGLVTPERIEMFVAVLQKLVRGLNFTIDNLETLVTIVGALKLAQLSKQTHDWARAFSGLGTEASRATGHIASSTRATSSLTSGTRGLVGGFARAASAAAGIAAALTSGYQVGSLLVKTMGWFQDETATRATKDDPNKKAAGARKMLSQNQARIAELEEIRAKRKSALELMPANHARRPAAEKRLAQVEADLAQERFLQKGYRADALATTITERAKARGTGATDDVQRVLAQVPVNDTLRRLGSGFAEDLAKNPIIQEFAPELAKVSDRKVLARVEANLRRNLDTQARREALAQVARSTQHDRPIQVSIDGQAVFTSVQNSPAGNRAPAP